MSAGVVILVEVDVTSPIGAATTLRFADRAVRPLPPTDAQRPNVVWDARLVKAPSIRRALLEDFSTLLAGWGVGAMQLANGDGALDVYEGYAWGEIRVWRYVEGTAFSTALRLFTGRAAQPSFASRQPRAAVSFYDHRVELDPAAQSVLYAGTGGYEGDITDLKGKPKPLAYGDLTDAHVPAPRVKTSVNAYQFHHGALAVIPTVYDGGANAGLVSDGAVSSAAFDAAAPAAAHQVADLSRGLIRFNANPVRQVTLGGMGEAGVASTVGPVLKALLTRRGVPAGRIGASFDALAAAATIGVWSQDTASARDLAQWVARSAPAAVLPDRAGVWQAIALAPPAAVPAFPIDGFDSLAVEPDESALEPVGEVRVGWGRVWTTFRASDLSPGLLGTAAEGRLASEYRYAVVEDAAAKARGSGSWRTLQIDTALRTEAAALALAANLKTLFGLRADGRPRRQWKVQLALTPAVLDVALGATVRLIHPPRGIDQLYLLIAEQPLEPRRDLVTWTVWG
jgi:hypothetical protein